MLECDFCNKNRVVTIKLELFNSEIDEDPEDLDSKRICMICLEKRNWKIDIREVLQFEIEDSVDFPEDFEG